tara:strand:+ start:3433 stop:4089 length:657 start_codon:yes stop_codon:yes gene_type:complete
MSYIWKEGEPRANNTVDVDGFNNEYNAYKSMLNGGLDRDNIPQNIIGDSEYVYDSTNAKTSTPFFRASQVDATFTAEYKGYNTNTAGNRCFGAARYEEYNSGFVEIATESLQCKEGMLQIEARGYMYINPVNASTFPKVATLRVTVDNVPVIETTGGYSVFMNSVYLVGSTPVAEGNVTVKLLWKFSPMGTVTTQSDSVASPQFFFDGISMLLLNRFR